MNKNIIKILIMHPLDPNGSKVGGIKTYIKNFIKYLPDNFKFELVGISSNSNRNYIGSWKNLILNGKKVGFLPILHVRDENKKSLVPLIALFVLSLFFYKKKAFLEDKILLFHRVEPVLLFRRHKNIKVLVIHGNMQDIYNKKSEIKWSKLPFLYFRLEKFLIGKINKIYIVNENGVNFYKNKYPNIKDRISFLPTCVDKEKFYPISLNDRSKKKKALLEKLGFPSNSSVVLFAGRLEKQKDPLLMIDVFKYINSKISQTRLIIAGAGTLEKEILKKIKRSNLQNTVYLFGSVTQENLSNIMKVSDVFLSTSIFEGMSMSILEALACGLPVVATDVGEVKKVVKNKVSGFISKDRNPETIGDLVIKILTHKKDFSTENCVESINNYNTDNVLGNFYDKLEKL